VCRLHAGKNHPWHHVPLAGRGAAPCWGSEAIRLGARSYRNARLRGQLGVAGVLFEICIVCVSVFVLLELTGLSE
jgi:hypothetical protein